MIFSDFSDFSEFLPLFHSLRNDSFYRQTLAKIPCFSMGQVAAFPFSIVKIDSIDKLRKDIDEDPIIRDSMAEVGALLFERFGRYLAPLLVLAHTANRREGFVENVMQVEDNIENKQDSDRTLVGDSSEK